MSARADSALREARALLDSGGAERAIDCLDRALATAPSHPDLHAARGDASRALDRLDDAFAAYRRAAELEPSRADYRANAGVAALLTSRHREASELLSGAAEAIADPRLFHLLSQALRGEGRDLEAETALRRAVTLAPAFADALVDLGVLERARGDAAAAEATWRRAVQAEPANVPARFNLANAARDRMALADAVSGYDRVLELDPGHRSAAHNRANTLLDRGDVEAAIAAYRALLERHPDHLGAATNLGAALLESGRYAEAVAACEHALAHHPGARLAQTLLGRARSKQVAGWHFDMLADRGRNEKYRTAIERAVTPGCRVLDIGTGSGLLAMLAARAGAAEVIGCELSTPIAEAAVRAVRDNRLEDRVRIVGERSTALEIGRGMDAPADVIVHEIFDAGLLGEGVLPSLRHALARLAAPGARVVPRAATVHARLVRLPRLRPVNPLRELCGLDLSAFDRFRDPSTHGQIWLPGEPHEYVSEAVKVAEVRFDPPPTPASDEEPVREIYPVHVPGGGPIDAVAFWFELDLGAGIRAGSGPDGELDHWGQAVQFQAPDLAVSPGETVSLEVSRSDRRFDFTVGRAS